MKTTDKMKADAQAKLQAELDKIEVVEQYCDTVGFKHVIHSRNYIAIFEVESIADARSVMLSYPPTNKTNKLGFAGKDDRIIDTPYHITFDSPTVRSHYRMPMCKIRYNHGENDIWLEFPTSLVEDFVTTGTRGVTDSEHHYFGGVSMREIRLISIRTYALTGGESVGYYGGNKVATNVTAIEKFISTIKEPNQC